MKITHSWLRTDLERRVRFRGEGASDIGREVIKAERD